MARSKIIGNDAKHDCKCKHFLDEKKNRFQCRLHKNEIGVSWFP